MGYDRISSYISPFSLDLAEQLAFLKENKFLTLVNLGNIGAKSYVIDQLVSGTGFQNVFWATTEERYDQIKSAAEVFFRGDIWVYHEDFSFRDFYFLDKKIKQKKETLFLFENLERSLDHKLPSIKEIEKEKVVLTVSKNQNIYELFANLEQIGYLPAKDEVLLPGEFFKQGDSLFIYPENEQFCMRIDFFGDNIEKIEEFIHPNSEEQKKYSKNKERKVLDIFPRKFKKELSIAFWDYFQEAKNTVFVADDLELELSYKKDFNRVNFTTFPQEETKFFHLNFFSVLPFYTVMDFVVDVKERLRRKFAVVIMTKRFDEIKNIFKDNEIMFTQDLEDNTPSTVKIVIQKQEAFLPHSFQNNTRNTIFLTDREIFQFRKSRQKSAVSGINLDMMTSLKFGDFVVHTEHGIAQFEGIIRKDLGKEFGTREYLKLAYAGGDRLFVPVESAERVSKFIGDDNPKLTRLGSAEWQKLQKKLKVDAERIAKELLLIYAKRKMATRKSFDQDDEMLNNFCDGFPYELTPGQASSWLDIRRDMESNRPMDRLLCGDVGFGKTEMAMRAAFKAFRSGKQTVILAPITILAEQHYHNFMKRVEGKNYGVKIALLSRFQSPKEQKDILSDLKHGIVDIVIGTHRVLSEDVEFDRLGLVVIDEEQRFGVKQKEKLKKIRAAVDILTMTATPIPRTLNMGLNKLKDISTITTAPPGRLPVITEVRRYNQNLIRDRILYEIKRGGQVYFLHNRVQTIESQAELLRALVPEATFVVAHGQLTPEQLEKRINAFKKGEYQVLIASTIIENGIDLPNANTLFVNYAERFGLSQLYQLRGRVGRRRTQAYSYFLYHGQRLEVDAKKRLRAIVEASELGSGFQIAMRDMEIRGAGEILGASQAGAMKNVGVSHFMRLLNKTVEEMKSGEISSDIEKEEENITVEIPISSYIPASFIPSVDEKIQIYKELSSCETQEQVDEFQHDLREDYGDLPMSVNNLCKVVRLKVLLREVNLSGIKINRLSHSQLEIVVRMGLNFSPEQLFGLIQFSKNKWSVTSNAIKRQITHLGATWYDDVIKDLKLLGKEKKGGKRK